jgi:hypothetical protein
VVEREPTGAARYADTGFGFHSILAPHRKFRFPRFPPVANPGSWLRSRVFSGVRPTVWSRSLRHRCSVQYSFRCGESHRELLAALLGKTMRDLENYYTTLVCAASWSLCHVVT